jgi:hypothetical protein
MYVPLIVNVTLQLSLPVSATNQMHTTKKPQHDDTWKSACGATGLTKAGSSK